MTYFINSIYYLYLQNVHSLLRIWRLRMHESLEALKQDSYGFYYIKLVRRNRSNHLDSEFCNSPATLHPW